MWRLRTAAGRSAVWALIGLTVTPGTFAGPVREARGVSVPIFVEGKARPVAAIRIDRVHRDHRRLGFFRVKALPVLVAEGVRLEVREPAGATNLLEELTRALQGLAGNRNVEARDVRILIGPSQQPVLEARRLCPSTDASGAAFGLERVRLQDGAHHIQLARAKAHMVRPGVLRLVGPDAVMLDYDLSCGRLTLNRSEPLGESP